MFTELKRVSSCGYINYIPKFKETFPELKNVSGEDMADRFRKLGVEFYTTERKPVSLLVRFTMPFAFITGKWRYDLENNIKLLNWFDAVGFSEKDKI